MERRNIDIKLLEVNKGQVYGLPKNPRTIRDERFKKLVKSIEDAPEMLEYRTLLVYPHGGKYVIVCGNMRYRACREIGYSVLPCVVLSEDTTSEKLREYAIKDNIGFGDDDWEALKDEWDVGELTEWGVEVPEKRVDSENENNSIPLSDRFIVPPFTILDSRKGYWRERKKIWNSKIGDNAESRENLIHTPKESKMLCDYTGMKINTTSLLDPVLCEVIVSWFGIEGGKCFDCFAGGSAFGYVSSTKGMTFTGIELREEQVSLNNERTKDLDANYICDDGQNVLKHIEENSQDLLFSCPPYFDLEVYSDKENDASNQKDYESFLKILKNAFSSSIKCLKDDRFAVVVCGDIRDKRGFYRNFPEDIKKIFIQNQCFLYNEMILIDQIGKLIFTANKYMKNRKIGKHHQNVLVFYKGDPRRIKENYRAIDYDTKYMESLSMD